ncbi:hypothetical protein WISP_86696 [Willisornis vidua]|uniref:Secreted protein n=1 Tax=Willisornis vidua TaxID=1566151 RepID=A0ABQ9D2Y6_9PASS|nr:hypothetical protein WISP_86696 [Willisornis vidua]
MVGFLGCKRILLALVELLVTQYTQALLVRAGLNPFSAQTVLVLGIALSYVQSLALGLVELHEVHMHPPLKPVKVPLNGIPFLHADCVVDKLAEGTLNPIVCVADKDVKQCQSRHKPLRNTSHHWSTLGHQAIAHNSLNATI